jgi:eukaryotic-like serine/threonine-protein kinase
MPISPGDMLGAFTLEKSLSGGEAARVFLAHDTRRPALKAVLKLARTDSRSRTILDDLLRRETDILTTLRHPGIVRIYPLLIEASGDLVYTARAENVPERPLYYALEYIAGESLGAQASRIANDFPLEWQIELFYQVLVIVDYLHQSGYAHGDLKPQNILFRHTPVPHEVPSPVLIDFGAAIPVEEAGQASASSFTYAAPEALLAGQSGIPRDSIPLYPDKIDVWALGAILFESLTGRPLMMGRTRTEILDAALNDELDSLHDVRPDLPGALDTLMRVMLRRNPETRPAVSQLIRAVEEKLSGLHPPRIGSADISASTGGL